MTQKKQIYKCDVCTNIVEVLHEGAGELVCCGEPMKLQEPKHEDQGQEKHVPIMEKQGDKIIVKVGDVPHPMEEEHFIEWIEIIDEFDRATRKFLKPGQEPKAEFQLTNEIKKIREYCNVHGLWENIL
jgi:superoxide reductase